MGWPSNPDSDFSAPPEWKSIEVEALCLDRELSKLASGLLSPGIPNGALAAYLEVTKMSNNIHTTATVALIPKKPLNYISGGYRAD
jgi:hypothetical protein